MKDHVSNNAKLLRQIVLALVLFWTNLSYAANHANSCTGLFNVSNRNMSTSGDSGRQFLAREISLQSMKSKGFDLVDTLGILSHSLTQKLFSILPRIGRPTINPGEYVAYDYVFERANDGSFPRLNVLPPEIGQPIAAFIQELTAEINRQLSGTEGKIKLKNGTIRNYSRGDLINLLHTHEKGYLSASIALQGPGTIIALDHTNPNLKDAILAKANQLALITDQIRTQVTGVPSTAHGSPEIPAGVERVIIFLDFELDPNP